MKRPAVNDVSSSDVIVIGAGLAGLTAALSATKQGARVCILTQGAVGSCSNSERASGGLAAVTGVDVDDSQERHLRDTADTACGLMLEDIGKTFVREAGEAIYRLEKLGAKFAQRGEGLALFDAPGHSRARSVRCQGGGTDNLIHPLFDQIKARDVKLVSKATVFKIERDLQGRASAVLFVDEENVIHKIEAGAIVLASGGLGQLFPLTSNNPLATGSGYFLALDAGATLMDLEFVQFTPSSLAYPPEVRGVSIGGALLAQRGVRLLNRLGERFMERYDSKRMEAATRDVLARAIHREVAEGRGTKHDAVLVDISDADRKDVLQVSGHFIRTMESIGVDPYATNVEVAPDVHFAMGGVAIDCDGRTGVPGLFAAGEAAAGLHGATRLNSNGLSEAAVFGYRAGNAAAQESHASVDVKDGNGGSSELSVLLSSASDPRRDRCSQRIGDINFNLLDVEAPPAARRRSLSEEEADVLIGRLRAAVWRGAGIERSASDCDAAILDHEAQVGLIRDRLRDISDVKQRFTLQAMGVIGRCILEAARARRESRGAHFRIDFPQTLTDWRVHLYFKRVSGNQGHNPSRLRG